MYAGPRIFVRRGSSGKLPIRSGADSALKMLLYACTRWGFSGGWRVGR